MAETRHGSILAADFGSVTTRVMLLDIVDGEYRLVARGSTPTTVGYPLDDVGIGLQRILQDTSAATGRTFFDREGRLIMPETMERAGVDYFVTTASAGRPMRAVLVGLMPEISLNSAVRAMNDVYIEPVAMLHLLDGLGEEGRLNAIMLNRPDLVLVAGGTEGGAAAALLDILKPVELAVRLTEPTRRPIIIYAGNSALAEPVKKLFGDLTGLFIAENVRPVMEDEALESAIIELGRAYDVHKERHGAGFSEIGALSHTGVLPTAGSYTLIAEYFAKTRKGSVIAIDLGSSTSVLVSVFGGFLDTTVSTTLGVGHSAAALVEQVGIEKLSEWLPFYPARGELKNYALNKSLRPAAIPVTLRDLYIEHAMVRAGIQHAIEIARPGWKEVDKVGPLPAVDLILAAGSSLTGTGTPAYNMMLIVDAIRPTGITDIKADPHGLLATLGALARVNAPATVQLLESTYLEHLGTVISISGIPNPEKTAITLKVKPADGETFTTEIKGGHLLLLPLPAGISIEIDMRLPRGLSINGKRRIKRKFTGGTAGILFDARGRPFSAGLTVAERADKLPLWVNEATDNPLLEIPENWLIEPEYQADDDEEAAHTETAAAAPRRGLFGFFRRGGSSKPAKSDKDKEQDEALDSLMSQFEAEDSVRRTTGNTGLLTPKKGLTGKLPAPEPKEDDDLDSLRNL